MFAETIRFLSSSFALSIMRTLLDIRTSSIFSTPKDALQGPTLSMVSRAAASIAVSTWSRLEGMMTLPLDLPFFESTFTSIRPILPLF